MGDIISGGSSKLDESKLFFPYVFDMFFTWSQASAATTEQRYT